MFPQSSGTLYPAGSRESRRWIHYLLHGRQSRGHVSAVGMRLRRRDLWMASWFRFGNCWHAGGTCRLCGPGASDAIPDSHDVTVDRCLDAVSARECISTVCQCFCRFGAGGGRCGRICCAGPSWAARERGSSAGPGAAASQDWPLPNRCIDLSGSLVERTDLRTSDTAGCNRVVAATRFWRSSLWLMCLSKRFAAHRSNATDCSLFLYSPCFRSCSGRSSNKRAVRWRISWTATSIA